MQKTSRLVVLGIVLISLVVLPLAASAQESEQSDSERWGESSQPEHYVRSKAPTQSGSAYNWRQMGAAGVVMMGMVLFIVVMVRRGKREQDTQ